MNVPALRFPEFEGEWKQPQLSELFPKVRNGFVGTATPFYDQAGIAYLQGKNIKSGAIDPRGMIRVNKVFHDKQKKSQLKTGDLLMVQSGHVGECAVVTSEFDGANCHALVVMTPAKEVESEFIRDLFYAPAGQRQIHKIKTGNTIEHVLTSDLKPLVLSVPSLPEQKKIAAFLGVVDAKIAALRERRAGLERYKRGLMQALFSQTLRFTKPDGTAFPDWEEKRLGEVATRSTAKNTKLEYMRVLTNSAVQGVVDQGDYFDKDIANAENLAGYYVLKKGDFVYNPRISVSAPVGPIKRNDLGDGVMSPLYTVFRFKQKDTTFYNVYFATTFWHKYMKSVANYGARHDRMAITSGDLMNMPLPHPHPDEQAKIAEALSAMDAKIAAVGDQVAQMEAFKKGLLQQMFV